MSPFPALPPAGRRKPLRRFPLLLSLLPLLLLLGARPAPAQPLLRGEPFQPIQNPSVRAAGDAQQNPAIAWGDGQFLTVFDDYREPCASLQSIYGTRVLVNGTVVDRTGFRISSAADPGFNRNPAVAWNGTIFLVVWWNTGEGLKGARVDASGNVLDLPSFAVAGISDPTEIHPEISWNGESFLVVWGAKDDLRRVTFGVRVGEDGTVLEPGRFPIGGDSVWRPSVTWGDGAHLVVWGNSSAQTDSVDHWIAAARVDAFGSILSPGEFMIYRRPGVREPRVAWNGSQYLVLWIRQVPNETRGFVEAMRLNSDCSPIDLEPLVLCDVMGAKRSPEVVAKGTDFHCVWVDDRGAPHEGYTNDDVYRVHVTNTGQILPPGGVPVFLDSYLQAGELGLAWSGQSYLCVWGSHWTDHGYDILGAVISASGAIGNSGYPIALSYQDQRGPAAAWMGSTWALVYEEDGATDFSDVRATLVDPAGGVQDPSGYAVEQAELPQADPDIAAGPNGALVVWEDSRRGGSDGCCTDIFGARLDEYGVVSDATGFLVGRDAAFDPSVAWGGESYIVVWGRAATRAARVTADGGLLDPIPPVIGDEAPVDIAGSGNQVLIVGHPNLGSRAVARRMAGNGRVLDTEPILLAPQARAVAVAGAPDMYLAVWRKNSTRELYGSRVLPSGTLVDTAGILIAADAGTMGAAAWNDGAFLVAWMHGDADSAGLYLSRMDADGAVERVGKISGRVSCHSTAPALVAGAAGSFLVSWDQFIGNAYGARRLWARVGTPAEVTPILLGGLEASEEEGRVVLEWWAEAAAFTEFVVRRTSEGETVEAGRIPAERDAGGGSQPAAERYTFEDDSAPEGLCLYTVSGRLREGGEQSLGPVAVEAPARAACRIRVASQPSAQGPVRILAEACPNRGPLRACDIYDLQGRAVRTIPAPEVIAAARSAAFTWDGMDEHGRRVPPGVYFARVRFERGAMVERLVTLR